MKSALELLKLATEKWPPNGGNHNLVVQDGVLTLYLFKADGTWQSIRFDGEGDLDKDPVTSIQEISALLDATPV